MAGVRWLVAMPGSEPELMTMQRRVRNDSVGPDLLLLGRASTAHTALPRQRKLCSPAVPETPCRTEQSQADVYRHTDGAAAPTPLTSIKLGAQLHATVSLRAHACQQPPGKALRGE